MTGPSTYAEWLPLLDRFRSGDDTALEAMRLGCIAWTNVVAERWSRQVAECLTARLQALSKQLQTALDRAHSEFGVSNALLMARRSLCPLREFAGMAPLPSELRDHLTKELDRWAKETQSSLETHAAGMRHDQGRLLKAIRDNPLTTPVSAAPPAGPPEPPAAPLPGRGRRIIF